MRLYAYIAAALILAGAAWYVHRLQVKAGERDAAVSALSDYRGAVEARDKQAAKDRAADESRRAALASTLDGVRAELQSLRDHPITSVVYREKIVNGAACPDPRIGPDWFRVRQSAQDITDRAVSRTD